MKPVCYILRGLPGSGKSTYAKAIAAGVWPDETVICSADDYFLGPDGEYKFDARKLGYAHSACKKKFENAVMSRKKVVIVDNTNTRLSEYNWYLHVASGNGYEVIIKTFDCDVETSFKRNNHGVPRSTIEVMAARFEK